MRISPRHLLVLPAAALIALIALGLPDTTRRSTSRPRDRAAQQGDEPSPHRIVVSLAGIPELPPEQRPLPREPREYLSRQMPAESVIGQIVQSAMSKRGDSDPRILDGLSFAGLYPADVASWLSVVDPWLSVGLVDLERQMARRCVSRGGQPEVCFERALLAEQSLTEQLPLAPATALSLFHHRDTSAHDLPSLACDLSSVALRGALEGDTGLLGVLASPCPTPEPSDLEQLRAKLSSGPQPPLVWSRALAWAIAAGDEEGALWAYEGLEASVAADRAGALREELAQARARLVVQGWLPARDWQDALRAAALHCAPDPGEIGGVRLYRARFEGGLWALDADDSYGACIELTVGPPEPQSPTEVALVVMPP